jgi:hypothetical protein
MKDEQGDVLNFIVIIPLIEEMVPFISKKRNGSLLILLIHSRNGKYKHKCLISSVMV